MKPKFWEEINQLDKESVPCELCQLNIVRGLIYYMFNGACVCEECKKELDDLKPIAFDGTNRGGAHARYHAPGGKLSGENLL